MNRHDDIWLQHLRCNDHRQEEALSDLRIVLLRALRRAFSDQGLPVEHYLEDAVQESLIRIIEKLPQFEGRSKFITWAISIAIRSVMSEMRRRHWKDISIDSVVENEFQERYLKNTLSNDEQSALLDQQHLIDTLNEFIQQSLTDKQRNALIAELRGMPLHEIAHQLGTNRNAVYKLTHDARKRLKTSFESAGIHATDISAVFTG